MGLPVMNPDGVGCCPPCTPEACSAEATMVCSQINVDKLICGFAALDGTNRRFGHAAITWTGGVDKTESAPSILESDNADVDVTGVFESNSRIVDDSDENCTDVGPLGDSCVELGTDGTLRQIKVYRDATPTYDQTATASCTAGTTYADVPYQGGWEASFEDVGVPANPIFDRCESLPFTVDSGITASSGQWSRGSTTGSTFGGVTYTCEWSESLTFSLTDEITYDELAAAVAAVPIPPASDGGSSGEVCTATFNRYNDIGIGDGGPPTIEVQYAPISFAFQRVSPATGKIRCFFTITTYFPDLATPIDVQELSVVIEDGNEWSTETLLEPDLYYAIDSGDGSTLSMEVTFSAGSAVPDC